MLDAGMTAIKRIKDLTVQKRLLNEKGQPNFGINFYLVNVKGEYAGVTLSNPGASTFSICTENGPQNIPLEPLLS